MENGWPEEPGDSPPWMPPGGPAEVSPDLTQDRFDPPTSAGRFPVSTWIVVVCAVLLVASVVAVFTLGGDDRVDGASSTTVAPKTDTSKPTTSGSEEPSTTEVENATRGAGGTGNPDVDRVLNDISRFVEAERGLDFKGPVEVELVDDAAFEARLLEDFEEDSEELERTAGQLRALGLIDEGVDLEAELRGLLGQGVLGFYDPETGELVVRGTDLTPYTRQTVAHELTHALDDQWFDLDRPELDDATDETGFAFSALVEGNARRVDTAYTNSMTALERRELQREEAEFAMNADFSTIPEVLVALIMAPYEFGPGLVAKVIDSKGNPGLDRSFESPPTTSEQVIHPPKFLAGEGPLPVTTPQADGVVTEEGVLGELVLKILLGNSLDATRAGRAAEGWGGDRYATWLQSNGKTCMRVDFVMDSQADLDELHNALDAWAIDHRGAKIEKSQDKVRLTACG